MIVLQFLTDKYQRGLPFNYLCTYISTLRNYMYDTFLNAHVIKKFLKGIFRLRPPYTYKLC